MMMFNRRPTDSERAAAATELLRRRRQTVEIPDASEPLIDRARADFMSFATQLEIVDKYGIRHALKPNAIQSCFEVERSQNGRDIVLKPRQVGLTTWELARDLWFFLTRRGARVVVVVQTDSDHVALRETSERLRIMFDSLSALGVRLDFRTQTVSEWVRGDASLRIVEAGASEARASKQGRGGTIHRLHITELAFFEFAKETLNALLECVPGSETGSEIVIESTANGASGVFFERYQRAKGSGDNYTPHFFRWVEHEEYSAALEIGERLDAETPRERSLVEIGATQEQIKWYRRKVADKGQDLVDQEYPIDEATCWLVAGRAFFDREKCVEMRGKTKEPVEVLLGGALRIFVKPSHAGSYIVVADPSEGAGGDPGAATVYHRETGEHVATLHGQFPVGVMAEHLAYVGEKYAFAQVVVERNNHGHAVLLALSSPPQHVERGPYPNIFRGRDGKLGWVTSETSRAAALDRFEADVRAGAFETPDAALVGEMLKFVVSKNGKAQAAPGAHDDIVITAAIACAVSVRSMNYRHEEYA